MLDTLITEYKQFTKDKEFKKEDIPALIWNLFHSEHIHEISFSEFKELFYELVNTFPNSSGDSSNYPIPIKKEEK